MPGKDAADENFPVASWLLPRRLRPIVMAFYRFAREADDIADCAKLPAEEKLARLDAIASALDGQLSRKPETVAATRLRHALNERLDLLVHARELLEAFRKDSVQTRWNNWSELMIYCRYSAAPVGRFLLDLHGESSAHWPAADALCAALQILNHIQDCKTDHAALDRVYIPFEWMLQEGADKIHLRERHCVPELRRVLDRMLDEVAQLLEAARPLPKQIKGFGLSLETRVTLTLAERLHTRLREQDPIAVRVRLTPLDFAAYSGLTLWRGLTGR